MKSLFAFVTALALAHAAHASEPQFLWTLQPGVETYSLYERTSRGVVHVADFVQTGNGVVQVQKSHRYFMTATNKLGQSSATPDVVTWGQIPVRFKTE